MADFCRVPPEPGVVFINGCSDFDTCTMRNGETIDWTERWGCTGELYVVTSCQVAESARCVSASRIGNICPQDTNVFYECVRTICRNNADARADMLNNYFRVPGC